ncbi:MAG: restriction endonuclease subunit S [Candidatus Saganbacteria bacterium]|nr:restriction endonuclease subunit S [Candidatus Saganbacteria bacterium]
MAQTIKFKKQHKRYPEYKDSGIEWIGKIPGTWKSDRLIHKLINNDGGVWGDDDPLGQGTIVLRSTEIDMDGDLKIDNPATRLLSKLEIEKAKLLEGDLLIVKSSGSEYHIGKTAIVTKEVASDGCVFSNFIQRLRVNKEINPKLLYYILNNVLGREQINYLGLTSSGLVNISRGTINQVVIPTQAIEIQSHIVSFLDQKTALIDQILEQKRKLIELLKEKRAAVINQAVTRGLDSKAKLVDSGIEWIGKVPEGWRVEKLKYIVNLRRSQSPDNNKKYLALENIESFTGRYLESEIEQDPDSITNEFQLGDVLFNKLRPYLAKALLPDFDGICTGELLVMEPRRDKINSQYLFCRVLSDDFLSLVDNSTYGAKMPRASWDFIGNIRIAFPDTNIQEQISEHIKNELSKVDALADKIGKSISLLQEYKSSIISNVVTGKVEV